MSRARIIPLALALLLFITLKATAGMTLATEAPTPAPSFTVITPPPADTPEPDATGQPIPETTPMPADSGMPEATAEPVEVTSPAPRMTRSPIPEADMPLPGADGVTVAIVTDLNGAALFEMPSTESAVLTMLNPAQVTNLVILGVTWSQVEADAVTGWVPTYQLGFTFGSPQPAIAVVTAPGGKLTLRAEMSTQSDALGTAYSGHAVLVLAKSEDFSLIRFEGKEGYVLTRYLREEFPGQNLGALVPVISVDPSRDANVRLRAEPSRQAATYTTVPSGSRIVVFEREDGWARVEWEGHSGYMMEDYLGALE